MNRHFSKEDTHMSSKHMKNVSVIKDAHVIRELQSKTTWNISTHLLKRPNLGQWWHQILSRIWSNRNSHSLIVGVQNYTTTLEDSLAVSYKVKPTLTLLSSNHIPFIQMSRNLASTKKNLHTDILMEALFITAKKLEATSWPQSVNGYIICWAYIQLNISQQ